MRETVREPPVERIVRAEAITFAGAVVHTTVSPKLGDLAHLLGAVEAEQVSLRLTTRGGDTLEVFRHRRGWLFCESYAGKRYFRDTPVGTRDAALELIGRYFRASVADVNDWYQPNFEWRNGYFAHPEWFELVNKRYRVRSAFLQAIFILVAVVLALSVYLVLHGGSIGIRGAIFALIVLVVSADRKIDFRDPKRKRL